MTTTDVRGPRVVAPTRLAPPGRAQADRAEAEPGPVRRRLTRAGDVAAGHVREARAATSEAWTFSQSPPAAGDMWREVLPLKGEAANTLAWLGKTCTGLFRALVITVCWLVALSVAGNLADNGRHTRIRAGVGLLLLVLVVGVGTVARALSP